MVTLWAEINHDLIRNHRGVRTIRPPL